MDTDKTFCLMFLHSYPKKRRTQRIIYSREHTSVQDWHYFLLYVTASLSSSNEDSSSEESPQSQESSESVSQEFILHYEEMFRKRRETEF